MELKNFYAQDSQGNTQPGASCYLYHVGTETLVEGLTDINDLPKTNPFYSDLYGLIQFKAPDGLYDLRIVAGSADSTIRIQFIDALEALAEINAAKDLVNDAVDDATDAATTATQQAGIATSAATTVINRGLLKPIGGTYYDATSLQIKNLADGSGDQDAANIKTVRNIVNELTTFVQNGSGAAARTISSKLKDIVSVADFTGADSTGLLDSTGAFLSAESVSDKVYVPDGLWKVDSKQITLAKYYGPGKLHTKTGSVIALETNVLGSHYVMRRIMEPFYGFNDGTTNTEIYAGAQYTPQGLAYHKDPVTGQERIFISQSVGSGADWGPDEYVRITEFLMREDGQIQNHVQFTPELRSSHAHLSAITDSDGKLYMYQSATAPVGTTDLGAGVGKGWSKMEWKGASNVTEDIQNFYVWGPPGSGHRYQNYGKGCVQVSQDGKYVIMVGINYSGGAGGRVLFVYDREQVEALPNSLDAEPIFSTRPVDNFLADGETGYQGETCDGRYIYITWGSGSVFGRRGITIYTLTGEKVRDIFMDGPAEQYTNDELFDHPTLGAATAFEPEGITIRGDEILVTFTDFFRQDPDVVTFEGVNYSNLMIGNIGRQPDTDQLHWKITTKAATRGAWDAATTYGVGNTTKRSKVIYSVRPERGTADEIPCSTTYTYPASVAQYPGNASILINASHDLGSTYRVSAHVVPTDTYRTSFDYRYGYTLAVFDQRAGADNSLRASLRMNTLGGTHIASVIAGGGTSDSGGYINLYSATSPSNPGDVRLSTVSTGSIRLMTNGATKFNLTDTETVLYQVTRPVSNNEYSMGTASRVFTTVYLQTNPVVSSDARLKTEVRNLVDAEINVGRRLAREIGFFKWLDSIEQKGESAARWHAGMTVQKAIQIFEDEGLDPFKYGMICHDEWGDKFETVDPVHLGTGVFDSDGNEITEEWAPSAERQTIWAGDKYSFREEQLKSLMVRAIAYDQDQIMARLDALESK